MKSCAFSCISRFCALSALLCGAVMPAFALDAETQYLDSDSIATRSLAVAESMRTSGYCYAGVSKAVAPLGVVLTGAAAYEARDQLLLDSRFAPVSTNESVDLRRGDIIVFNKSISHPYGHICVYQGNGQESSDHVSQLSNPDKYGGYTVFRLRSEAYDIAGSDGRLERIAKMPMSAPDFRNINGLSNVQGIGGVPGAQKSALETSSAKSFPAGLIKGENTSVGKSRSLKEFFRREFRTISKSPEGKSLKNRLVRFVMSSW